MSRFDVYAERSSSGARISVGLRGGIGRRLRRLMPIRAPELDRSA